MRKIIKDILFSIVLVIIALHAIIPHPYSSELTQQSHFEFHKKTNSLIGGVRLAFHESDGDNLDNHILIKYGSAKKLDFQHISPTVSLFNNPLLIVEPVETVKAVEQHIDNFIKLHFVSPNGLRGPPSLA